MLAPGEVVFRDPRVSRYSKNSSIVTNVGDFVVSVVSMVCLLSRKYLLVSGRTIVHSNLLAIAIPDFLKNGGIPGCPGKDWRRKAPRPVGAVNFDMYAHF